MGVEHRCARLPGRAVEDDLCGVIVRRVSRTGWSTQAPWVSMSWCWAHDETVDRLAVVDVRPFVPAADFATSKAFYEALGWTTIWTRTTTDSP